MFDTLDITQLSSITGGASAWDAYVKSQRKQVAPAFKQVVCTTAGIKGGPEMATQVYGKERANQNDMIRASETLRGICLGGERLPEAAPQSPF